MSLPPKNQSDGPKGRLYRVHAALRIHAQPVAARISGSDHFFLANKASNGELPHLDHCKDSDDHEPVGDGTDDVLRCGVHGPLRDPVSAEG